MTTHVQVYKAQLSQEIERCND